MAHRVEDVFTVERSTTMKDEFVAPPERQEEDWGEEHEPISELDHLGQGPREEDEPEDGERQSAVKHRLAHGNDDCAEVAPSDVLLEAEVFATVDHRDRNPSVERSVEGGSDGLAYGRPLGPNEANHDSGDARSDDPENEVRRDPQLLRQLPHLVERSRVTDALMPLSARALQML